MFEQITRQRSARGDFRQTLGNDVIEVSRPAQGRRVHNAMQVIPSSHTYHLLGTASSGGSFFKIFWRTLMGLISW